MHYSGAVGTTQSCLASFFQKGCGHETKSCPNDCLVPRSFSRRGRVSGSERKFW